MADIPARLRNLQATAATWTTHNPVLLDGEVGYESDTQQYKVGNGTDPWSALPYWGGQGMPAVPDDGWTYGFLGDPAVPTRVTSILSGYAGDLDLIPPAHAQMVEITGTPTNGWPGAGVGDWVLDFEGPSSGQRMQIGFNYTSSGTANQVIYTRVLQGTWTPWSRQYVEWDDVQNKPADFPPSPHTHVEDDITDLNRVRWRSPYTPGAAMEKNDMVLDGDWTMIANKDTSERAAPQENQDDTYDLPDDNPLWTNLTHTGVVESGRAYLTEEPVTLVGYQVWIPDIGADVNTVIRTFAYTQPDMSDIVYREISEPILQENAWSTVAIQQTLILPGTVFGIVINSLNSGADTLITGGWTRATNSNDLTVDPGNANWGTNNAETSLRFNYIDADSTDRTSELQGIVAGSQVVIANTADPNQSMTWTVGAAGTDQGTHISFANVTYDGAGVGGEPAVGVQCTVTINVPVPSPTQYVELTGGNPFPPPGAGGGYTQGILRFDGVDQPGADVNAYGVRILLRSWTVPVDWDVVSTLSLSGGGGGGGGGGVTEFTALIDTPPDYVGQAGNMLRVGVGETGLEFFDPVAGDGPYVLKAGDTMTGRLTQTASSYQITDNTRGTFYFNGATGLIGYVQNTDANTIINQNATPDGSTATAIRLNAAGDIWFFNNGGQVNATIDYAGATDLPNGTSIVTKERGDALYLTQPGGDSRYVQLAGDTMTGQLVMSAGGEVQRNQGVDAWTSWYDDATRAGYVGALGGALRVSNSDASYRIDIHPTALQFFAGAVFSGQIEAAGTSMISDQALATREKGDARWLRITDAENDFVKVAGDTMTGRLILDVGEAQALTMRNTAADDTQLWGRRADNSLAGMFRVTDEGPQLLAYDENSSLIGTYQWRRSTLDVIATNGFSKLTTASNSEILQRQMGDTRYVELAGDTMTGQLNVNNYLYVDEQVYGGFGAWSTTGVTNDWNDPLNARSGNGANLLLGTDANGHGAAGYYHPFCFEYSSKDGTGNLLQMAFPYSTGGIWFRWRVTNSWGAWKQLHTNDNADARYVVKSGDTMTGALTVAADGASITSNGTFPYTQWLHEGALSGYIQGSVDNMTIAQANNKSRMQLNNSGPSFIGADNVYAARVYNAGTAMIGDQDVITREKGDARYVETAGDTMTGTLTLNADLYMHYGTPLIWLWANGAPTDQGGWFMYANDSSFRISRASDVGGNLGDAMRIDRNGTGTTLTSFYNDMRIDSGSTRDRLDFGSGGAYIERSGAADNKDVIIYRTDTDVGTLWGASQVTFFEQTVQTAIIEPAGQSIPAIKSVITAEKGDARYLALSGGTMTGRLTHSASDYQITDSTRGTFYYNAAAQLSGYIQQTDANMLLVQNTAAGGTTTTGMRMNATGDIWFFSQGGNVWATIDGTSVTDLPNTTSLVNRAAGDARYAPVAATSKILDLLVAKGILTETEVTDLMMEIEHD